MSDFSRRTVVRGAAWSVPVIAVVAQAPAFAASAPPIVITYSDTSKCPGQSTSDKPWTYILHFTADSAPAQGSVSVSSLIINGTTYNVRDVVIEGTEIYVISDASSNSADASGSATITYTSGFPPVTKTVTFVYDGSHPNHSLCGRLA